MPRLLLFLSRHWQSKHPKQQNQEWSATRRPEIPWRLWQKKLPCHPCLWRLPFPCQPCLWRLPFPSCQLCRALHSKQPLWHLLLFLLLLLLVQLRLLQFLRLLLLLLKVLLPQLLPRLLLLWLRM